MPRLRSLAALTAVLLSASACDFVDDLVGTEDADYELTTAALTGKIIHFTNPSPNTSIGEHGAWDYTFRAGQAVGCNSVNGYVSDGWEVRGAMTIRVYFGQQWEQYELTSASGTLEEGNFKGKFRLTSSVPGNVVPDGSFTQADVTRFSGCNR